MFSSPFRRSLRSTIHHRRLRNFGLASLRGCESLEERVLLATSPVWVESDPSEVDGILIHLREDAAVDWDISGPGPISELTPNVRRIELSPEVELEAELAQWRDHPDVLFAEPDHLVRLMATPNDPELDALWGLDNIGQTGGTADADIDAAEAWDLTTGSGDMIVAVIDTGVDYRHEDLQANMWQNPGEIAGDGIDNDGNGYVDDVYGYDFANNDPDPLDDHNHGTHVSGTIGAVGNNGIGVVGVNWDVQIMAVKFLDQNGSGAISDAIEALEYAVDNGARISNNSWGFNGAFSQALQNAVAAAQSQGHIFVAAAGNGNFLGFGLDNDTTPFWPANIALDNVVSVAALDDDDQRATFSNFGATTVDVGGPGVGILSTTIADTYSTFNGTSMAAPHVSGALALLWDAEPAWSYQEVINRLFTSVDPVAALEGRSTTGGRINARSVFEADTTGPQLTSSSPTGEVSTSFDRIRLVFNEMIDAATLTPADVVQFDGPDGPVPVIDVVPAANSLGREFDLLFGFQEAIGEYRLEVGSGILDAAGNPLDQDRDGVGGEPGDDHYLHTVTLLPFVGRYDFGTSQSPVAAGYDRVLPWTEYSAAAGFGWIGGGGAEVDRLAGDAVTRDLIYAPQMTFAVDVPGGAYDIALTLGDLDIYPHDLMRVSFEGTPLDVVSTAAGEVLTRQYSGVAVGDGQLTLELLDQGGTDANAIINGLVVLWAGEDTTGPQVLSSNASGTAARTLDRLTVQFNEHLAAGSFTIDDVISFTGPSGPLVVSSVVAVDQGTFEINFNPQTEVGEYRLTLSAEIEDKQGNRIDQDGDGTGGESPDDEYTAIFELEPLTLRYDFGPLASPVASGFTQVTPSMQYSSGTGFGWQGSGGTGIDRSSPDPLGSDLVYAPQLVFEADAPDGVYDVTLTIGDAGPYLHDEIHVVLEGIERSILTSSASQLLQPVFTGVTVSDGRLTLELIDGGGQDANAVLNGAEFTFRGPDTFGPQITSATPAGDTSGPVDRISLTFNEPLDASSLTVADVSITGPAGAILPLDVTPTGLAQFEVSFNQQAELGLYQVTIAPDLRDIAGNLMDQDGDGTGGESGDDDHAFDFTIVPAAERFDFGTTGSPLAAGHTRVTHATQYSTAQGYGYLDGQVIPIDRGLGTDASRDFHYTSAFTFAVDGLNGVYDVELTIGDTGPYGHESMAVLLEGTLLDTISTRPGEVLTRTYSAVTVADGQMTLRMEDLGGADPNVVINALSVTRVGQDTSPPRVLAISPAGPTAGPVDRITVDFSKPIDAATFTPDDVVALSGPAGPIAVTSVVALSASQFEIAFEEQSQVGFYAVELSSDISDLAGTPLDQDQDGVPGEELDDRYLSGFSIAPFTLRFDFGTSFSPVASGYQQVLPSTSYTSSNGYGWQSGGLLAVDRGGDPLSGDLVYASQATFAADVPDGMYEITLTTGDLGPHTHDQIEIQAEGVRIDTVSTPAGQVLSLDYVGIPVIDGQLNLQLLDVGGFDPNIVLNGLEIRALGVSAATRILSATHGSSSLGAVDRARVVFNRPIDAASFTPSDVSLAGPSGSIAVTAVTPTSGNEFDVFFPAQSEQGTYTLTIEPQIEAVAGGEVDQDGDGLPGEIPDDRFATVFEVEPFSARFDFGSFGSPVEPDHVHVLPWELYAGGGGYGYISGNIGAVDRFTGGSLDRDIHYGTDFTFAVDVPDGVYDLTVSMGDRGPYAHEQMGVYVEGQWVDTVSTDAGEVRAFIYTGLAVQGGRLELRLADLGGPDANAVVAGLEIQAQPAASGLFAAVDAAIKSWRGDAFEENDRFGSRHVLRNRLR